MSDGFQPRDLLDFERMIAPTIIKVIYWIGLLFIVVGALIGLLRGFAAMADSVAHGLGQIMLSMIGLVVGTLVWRILMELYIVVFGIHDRLGQIRDSLAGRGNP